MIIGNVTVNIDFKTVCYKIVTCFYNYNLMSFNQFIIMSKLIMFILYTLYIVLSNAYL